MKKTILFLVLALSCRSAFAEIPSSLAVRAIIGEASGEGYQGMLAVAEAIRNRGHLKGVYGLEAAHISKEGPEVWKAAKRAWAASERSNTVHGASVWGNAADVKKFKKASWFRNCKQTAKIGSHYFFKEKS